MRVLTFLIISLAISGCASKSMSERADWMVKKVIRKIKLDKMQAAKLWGIKHKYFEIREGKKKERDGQFNELLSLIKSQDMSKKEVKDMIAKGRKMQDEYFPEVFPLVKDFHKSLSQEQKEKVARWLDELRRRFDL